MLNDGKRVGRCIQYYWHLFQAKIKTTNLKNQKFLSNLLAEAFIFLFVIIPTSFISLGPQNFHVIGVCHIHVIYARKGHLVYLYFPSFYPKMCLKNEYKVVGIMCVHILKSFISLEPLNFHVIGVCNIHVCSLLSRFKTLKKIQIQI